MKTYNPDEKRRMYAVEITLQNGEYFGHITLHIDSDDGGLELITFFDFETADADCENDCNLQYDEEFDFFTAELTDENENKLEIEGDAEYFNRMIVKVEIIDFKEER